jgi:hypothetical protein
MILSYFVRQVKRQGLLQQKFRGDDQRVEYCDGLHRVNVTLILCDTHATHSSWGRSSSHLWPGNRLHASGLQSRQSTSLQAPCILLLNDSSSSPHPALRRRCAYVHCYSFRPHRYPVTICPEKTLSNGALAFQRKCDEGLSLRRTLRYKHRYGSNWGFFLESMPVD